jgi:hypothetical protein
VANNFGLTEMSPYKVMVDDNFHYMDEDERREYGNFPSAEDAVAACRKLVDESLMHEYREGATAEQLYDRYVSFGDDPFVVAPEGAAKLEFSARDYARDRAQELTAPGLAGTDLRREVLERGTVKRSSA